MASLLDRLAPFKGTMPNALIHNGLIVARRQLPGPKSMVTVDMAHEPMALDLDLMKEMGLIETKSIGIIARQGFGKTFLMYILLILLTAIQTADRMSKIMIHSLKRNNMQKPETKPLMDILDSQVIDPHSIKLNALAWPVGMTYNEQLTMLMSLIRLQRSDHSITDEMIHVLKNVLSIAWEDKETNPSIPGLQHILNTVYLPPGLIERFKGRKTAMSVQDESEFTAQDESDKIPDLLSRNPEVFEKAALELYLTLGAFLEGEFLGMFTGTDDTFIEKLEQRGISVDLKGLTPLARAALEIVLSSIFTSAMMPEEGDTSMTPKHPERIPTGTGVDEAYSEWNNPVVAERLYTDSKTQRERGRTTIYCFHRMRDLMDAIIDPGAQKMAANSINEIEVWFIGRQGSAEDVEWIKRFFGNRLPQHVTDTLRSLPKGFFWLLVPNQSPVQVMVVGTDRAIKAFNTEGAHHRHLEQWRKTGDPRYYSRYLRETTPTDDDEPSTKEKQDEMATTTA